MGRARQQHSTSLESPFLLDKDKPKCTPPSTTTPLHPCLLFHKDNSWRLTFLIATVLTIVAVTRFFPHQPAASIFPHQPATTWTLVKVDPKAYTPEEIKQSCRSRPHTGPPACPFGTLPGRLNISGPTGEKWQTLSKACALKNYMGGYIQRNSSAPPVSMLFLSDSMDGKVLEAYCHATGVEFNKTNGHHKFNSCINKLRLHQVYLPTLTPSKRVFLPVNYQGKGYPYLAGYKLKMDMARGNWSDLYPGKEPDLVVMGGGLWDIFRWLWSPRKTLEPIERTVKSGKTISPELLDWYVNHVSDAVCYAKHLFPDSKLVWRSFAMPAWNGTSGEATNDHLGTKEMLAEVKAAGLAAAADLGVEIVRVEPLVESAPDAAKYLEDMHHPRPEYMLEVLNILLNIAFRENEAKTATR